MLFCCQLPFKKNDETKLKDVVIGFINDDGEYSSQSTILHSLELLNAYVSKGYALKVLFDEERNLPFIVCESLQPTRSDYRITKIYNLLETNFIKLKENVESQISELQSVMFKQLNGQLSEKVCNSMVLACLDLFKYCQLVSYTDPIAVSASMLDKDFMKETNAFLESNKKLATTIFTKISANDNVTKFMKSCNDELFIKLPSWEELTNEDIDVYDLIPSQKSVCTPYDNPIYYTPKCLEMGLSDAHLKTINGDRNNDLLEIQPNEELYKTSLEDWVSYNMKKYYESDNSPIIDPISKDYLRTLIFNLYMWGWSHNPMVPSYTKALDDEDSGEAETSNFVFNAEAGTGVNALFILESFLDKASEKLGYGVYIEAVIKLARWGSRKCYNLTLKDYNKKFDLNTCMMSNNFGDITKYKFESRTIKGFITLGEFLDKKYLETLNISKLDIPIGTVVTETFKHETDSDRQFDTPMYYSMLDFIKLIKNGEISTVIYDGEYHLTLPDSNLKDINLYQFNMIEAADLINASRKTEFKKNPFYSSKELSNLCMEFPKVDASNINQISILNQIRSNKYLSHELEANLASNSAEITKKLNDGIAGDPTNILRYSIFNHIIKVYVEAQKNLKVNTLINMLNAYEFAIDKCNYVTDVDFYSFKNDYLNSTDKENKEPETMNSFGESKSESNKETEMKEIIKSFPNIIEEIPEGFSGQWCKIINKSQNGEVLCGLLCKGNGENKKWYITNKPDGPISGPNINAVQLYMLLGRRFLINFVTDADIPIKFADNDSLMFFLNKSK